MTSTAPQYRLSTHRIDDTSTTTQYSSKTDKATETDSTATRSKPSHLCITIRWCGPACGRPGEPCRAATDVAELLGPVRQWSSC